MSLPSRTSTKGATGALICVLLVALPTAAPDAMAPAADPIAYVVELMGFSGTTVTKYSTWLDQSASPTGTRSSISFDSPA